MHLRRTQSLISRMPLRVYREEEQSSQSSQADDGAGGNDAGGGGGSGDGKGADSITLTRADYDKLQENAGRASGLQTSSEDLEKFKTAALQVMRGEGDDMEGSLRTVMGQGGYTTEAIEDYIKTLREGETTVDDVKQNGSKGGIKESEDDLEKRLKSIEDSNERAMAASTDTEVRRLNTLLTSSVKESLDTSPKLSTLVERAKVANTKDDKLDEKAFAAASTILSQELERETRQGLLERRRKDTQGWTDSWIEEETAKAAERVSGKYRSVIGDPSRLGRTAETGAGVDEFLRSTPKPAPEFKEGMGVGSVEEAVHSFAEDHLLRGALESAEGSRA